MQLQRTRAIWMVQGLDKTFERVDRNRMGNARNRGESHRDEAKKIGSSAQRDEWRKGDENALRTEVKLCRCCFGDKDSYILTTARSSQGLEGGYDGRVCMEREVEVKGGVRRKYQATQGTEYGQIEGNGWPGGEGGWPDAHVSAGGRIAYERASRTEWARWGEGVTYIDVHVCGVGDAC
jgi:hypothetical protein